VKVYTDSGLQCTARAAGISVSLLIVHSVVTAAVAATSLCVCLQYAEAARKLTPGDREVEAEVTAYFNSLNIQINLSLCLCNGLLTQVMLVQQFAATAVDRLH
jgi:hypothetical protein